jgi:hypothetical protein
VAFFFGPWVYSKLAIPESSSGTGSFIQESLYSNAGNPGCRKSADSVLADFEHLSSWRGLHLRTKAARRIGRRWPALRAAASARQPSRWLAWPKTQEGRNS